MDKQYPGVNARGNSVQINLTINGRRARFSIDIPPTPLNLKHAANVRAAAKLDISKGTFDVSKFFPDSKSSFVTSKQTQKISDALVSFLRDSERLLAPSTLRDYTSAINHHLVPYFGSTRMGELTTNNVKDWIADQCISAKRINNVLIPLRKVFSDAFYAGSIHSNPLDRVKHLQHTSAAPDPFTLDEMEQILENCSSKIRALFQFAFWTGLRTSELIALEWRDVSLKEKRAYICKAEIRGELKSPKTFSGTRTIQLLPAALSALNSIVSPNSKPKARVFINPKTNAPWKSDGQIRKSAWIPTLEAAGVDYRRPYQTRHTYASQLLSLGVEPMWVAQQMGHKDWGMIRRVYGRWISDSRPDITQDIEAKLAQIGHTVT